MKKSELVAFGEILLRLSPPQQQLLKQTASLEVHVGGAEANVCIGLACLGHRTRMISVLPVNVLGDLAQSAILASGVDASSIERREGRMGLYFLEPGASLRASKVLYDRADSAFALTTDFDWPCLLKSAGMLHVSGITAALGRANADTVRVAMSAAKAANVPVSFDVNYRTRLWESWNEDPSGIIRELASMASLLFGNHRDISLMLGRSFSGDGPERRREAAQAAFDAFPALQRIASTARHVVSVDHHRLSARLDTREAVFETEDVELAGIVDRIGAGDAFAAGVLHVLLKEGSDFEAVHSGLALACLKHSQPGDASIFSAADLEAFSAAALDVQR